jgi:hypothetical protein
MATLFLLNIGLPFSHSMFRQEQTITEPQNRKITIDSDRVGAKYFTNRHELLSVALLLRPRAGNVICRLIVFDIGPVNLRIKLGQNHFVQ